MHEDEKSTGQAPIFNAYVFGGTSAQGVNVTQNVGANAADMADLVRCLRDGIYQIDLEANERERIVRDIEVIDDVQQSTESRIGAIERIRTALSDGGGQVAAAGILALLENIKGAIGG